MKVLLTNDDGIDAPGILALEKAVRDAGFDVLIAAPSTERSGCGHSISFQQDIKLITYGNGKYAVTGTPVDTVHLTMNQLFKDENIDLVISGINRGANLACDVNYSGTVGAAREACMLGFPSFAISLETFDDGADFSVTAKFGADLAKMFKNISLPPRTFLNVNVPELEKNKIKGVKTTTLGIRSYDSSIAINKNEQGEKVFQVGSYAIGGNNIAGSDIVALQEGYISVTPIQLDQTNKNALDWLDDQLTSKGPAPKWR